MVLADKIHEDHTLCVKSYVTDWGASWSRSKYEELEKTCLQLLRYDLAVSEAQEAEMRWRIGSLIYRW